VSVDTSGAITTINTAASRLLSLPLTIVGHSARAVFDRADLRALVALMPGPSARRPKPSLQEIAIPERPGAALAVVARAHRESGATEGVVLVFDDVTPLIRAQNGRGVREVARRLAHEIQESSDADSTVGGAPPAHFQTAAAADRTLVDECTETIVARSSRSRPGRRVLAVRAHAVAQDGATDLGQLISETVALYNGIFADVRIEQRFCARFAARAAGRRADPPRHHQPGRPCHRGVDRRGRSSRRQLDTHSIVRVVWSTTSGHPAGRARKKLFLVLLNQGRGSGLGLAIVRRNHRRAWAAASRSATTSRAGTRLPSNFPC